MKIALIDPSLFTWPYDNELAQALRANGHEVVIFGKHLAEGEPGKHAPQHREFFYAGLERPWAQALPKALLRAIKGLMHPFDLKRLLGEITTLRPDAIHFQWVPLPAVDRHFIGAFGRIAPVILTVHDSTPFNDNPGSRLQKVGATSIMRLFDRVIVHTAQAEARLAAYGIEKIRIARIPHGAMDAGFAPLPATAAPPADAPVVLLVFGKVKPYKGVDVLIRALALMPAALRARVRVRIVGKPYMDVAPLKALAKELGVEDSIAWELRFVDDNEIAGLFAGAAIMVMPYREIDASGVLMQALAAGKPIVASRIGLFAELLEDGRHGRLVAPDDPKALAEALGALADDAALRATMGEQVRMLKDSIPGWRTIAQMTEAVYREAIKERRG